MKFKLESQFQTEFSHWLEKNPPEGTEAHELKLVRAGNFPIRQWIEKSPHQTRGLMQAKHGGCYHKISDMSRELKPFDSFYIRNAGAFLVVYFNEFERFIKLDVETAISLTKKQKTASFSELEKIGVSCSL